MLRLNGLDLFCGAGGCSVGYSRAGIRMRGIDWRNQPRYPFDFAQEDIRTYFDQVELLDEFDFIHASPPCQQHSRLRTLVASQSRGPLPKYINLIPGTRELLDTWAIRTGGIWIMENVPGAPMKPMVTLCGTQFGLQANGRQLQRHRWFESNIKLTRSGCRHKGRPWGIYGNLGDQIPKGGDTPPTLDIAANLMGIDWMTWKELREAIPPVYTEFLGYQVVETYNKRLACETSLVSPPTKGAA